MRKKTHRLAAGKKREASARSPIGLCYNGLGFHFEIGRSFVILIRITPPLANELARSIHRAHGRRSLPSRSRRKWHRGAHLTPTLATSRWAASKVS